MTLASYSAVMIVAGGSGATFALSVAEELVQNIEEGAARTKLIELVWTVQDMCKPPHPSPIRLAPDADWLLRTANLVPFVPTLSTLLDRCQSTPGIRLKISISYTRAVVPSPTARQTFTALKTLPAGLELGTGRPKLARTLDSVLERAAALPDVSGVAVGVCGPMGLVEEVSVLVRDIDGPRRAAVRGVDIHDECVFFSPWFILVG